MDPVQKSIKHMGIPIGCCSIIIGLLNDVSLQLFILYQLFFYSTKQENIWMK